MVSIIVPVYKAEKYIKLTLESIISQDYRDFEIVLIDDSGNDSSIEIAKNCLKDKNIQVQRESGLNI